MRSILIFLSIAGLFSLFDLNATMNAQPLHPTEMFEEDSIDMSIEYSTAYPGTETWLELKMRNPVPVSSYNLELMMNNPDAVWFCRDDTGGCIIAEGGLYDGCECFGEPCLGVHVWWIGGDPIPPTQDYQTLFRICANACCIPDTSSDRCELIFLQGQLSDEGGNLLPYRYHQGELCVWWSVPGDANGDSLVMVADVVFLINYLYRGGPEPCMCEAADCNGDAVIDLGDLVFLINYLFRDGDSPLPGAVSCPHENCLP